MCEGLSYNICISLLIYYNYAWILIYVINDLIYIIRLWAVILIKICSNCFPFTPSPSPCYFLLLSFFCVTEIFVNWYVLEMKHNLIIIYIKYRFGYHLLCYDKFQIIYLLFVFVVTEFIHLSNYNYVEYLY